MKKKTETILVISKLLALFGGIGYSIMAGSKLFTLVASFINPEWAKRTYEVDLQLFSIRDQSISYYVIGMVLTILALAFKVLIWYTLFELLQKLKLQTPFTIDVERKLEKIAYLMFGVWLMSSIFWKIYAFYLLQDTGIQLSVNTSGDEYLFLAGIVYIISQVFKRGIEIQEENQLTV